MSHQIVQKNARSPFVTLKKLLFLSALFVIGTVFLSACNQAEESSNVQSQAPQTAQTKAEGSQGVSNSSADAESKAAPEAEPEPVTIKVGYRYLNEEEVQRYIIDPVSKQYPWITVEAEFYTFGGIKDLVVSGEIPDVFITNNVNGIPPFEENGLLTSIEDLIKKHNMDLSRFEPETLAAVKEATSREDLVGLPYTRHFSALYYNKEIFDRFGVDYPADGLTWDEVTELAKQVTRFDEGVQYRGLEPNVPERMASQLSLPFVDPETNQSVLNTEPWQKIFNQMLEIYSIPGNEEVTFKGDGQQLFTKERRLAMFPELNIITAEDMSSDPDFWDMASYPVFPEAPNRETGPDLHVLLVSSVSKHKDDAFRVISAVVSDEVQVDMARYGKLNVMADSSLKAAFAENLDYMADKNIQGVFRNMPAEPYPATLYDREAITILTQEIKQVVAGDKDVNTALRDANERLNQAIASYKE